MKISSGLFTIIMLLSHVNFDLRADDAVIRIPKARASFDISHDYHVRLLTLALQHGNAEQPVPRIDSTLEMVQGRAELELAKGKNIDLYWLGADNTKEAHLRSIKIPTSMGLIGYRKFLVLKENQHKFSGIKSLSDFESLVACQGSHWPDTQILRSANLKVTTNPRFDSLFKMLVAGRCDYFPRGFHDADREVEALAELYPELISIDDVVFHYPFAIYFYTHTDNEALAMRIEAGMKSLAESGKLLAFMKSHPLTAHIFPIEQYKIGKIFELPNNNIPLTDNYLKPNYWIKLEAN